MQAVTAVTAPAPGLRSGAWSGRAGPGLAPLRPALARDRHHADALGPGARPVREGPGIEAVQCHITALHTGPV